MDGFGYTEALRATKISFSITIGVKCVHRLYKYIIPFCCYPVAVKGFVSMDSGGSQGTDIGKLIQEITTHFDTQSSRDVKFKQMMELVEKLPPDQVDTIPNDTGRPNGVSMAAQRDGNPQGGDPQTTPPQIHQTTNDTGNLRRTFMSDGSKVRDTEPQNKPAPPPAHATTSSPRTTQQDSDSNKIFYHSQPHTTQQDSGSNKIFTACDIPGWQPWGGTSGKWTQLGTIGGGARPVGHLGVAGELKRTVR